MKFTSLQHLKIIIIIFAALLSSACSLSSNNNDSTKNTGIPYSPGPSNNAGDQSTALTLTWSAENATKFDVYFGTANPPTTLYARGISTKYIDVSNLAPGTRYYWKVVSKYDIGDVTGDVWTFTTSISSVTTGGYYMSLQKLQTTLPDTVSMIFRVVDYSNGGVGGLVKNDFQLLEDNAAISASESQVLLSKKTDVFDTLRVVLMLDNSTSLTSNISQIRIAADNLAQSLVTATVGGVKLNVQVAVYQFSDNIQKITDFTSDANVLHNAITSGYVLGYATTNLYGAVIQGVSKWTDIMTSDKIRQGVMILFTDGSDTQGSQTFAAALAAVASKKVFTVGLGNDIDPYVLQKLGTAGYYGISDISQLETDFDLIQSNIIDYINSFYVLKYVSPKRGNVYHTLRLSIPANSNTGSGSYITGQYNSYGFYSN